MTSNPNEPEVMERQQVQADDKLSQTSAPSGEITRTQLVLLHSTDQTPWSPGISLGFLTEYRRRWEESLRTREPTSDPIMLIQIERLDPILDQFDPKLTKCQDRHHLAFCSLPTNILLMAQELLKVKTQLKSGAQIVGQERA